MYWMLFMTILSAFHVIHAWCEQIKLLKGLLNFFCGNEYVKYVIDGKVYMKLYVEAREKNYLRQKIVDHTFCI